MVDLAPAFCWERQKLQLAWQIAETPQSLLGYLSPYMPDFPSRPPSQTPPPSLRFSPRIIRPHLVLPAIQPATPTPRKSLRQSELTRHSMHSILQRGVVRQISRRAGGAASTGSAATVPSSNRVTSSSETTAVAEDTDYNQDATYMPADLRPLSNAGLTSQDTSSGQIIPRQHDIPQPSRSAFTGQSSKADRAAPPGKVSKLSKGRELCYQVPGAVCLASVKRAASAHQSPPASHQLPSQM